MKKLKDSQFIQLAKKIKNNLFKDKKGIILFGLFFSIGSFFFFVENVYAIDFVNGLAQFGAWAFEKAINFVLNMVQFLFHFFLKLAQYNGYIDGSQTPIVQIGWILVRDVANMFFVVIMLVIAFGTILGLENYQWNKLLGKLIFAAIFINFSNMICGLIIDVAYVFSLTFLNAIINTAGTNLVNTVHMDQLNNFVSGESKLAKDMVSIFVANVVAFIFSFILLLTIGAYTVVMLLRMVVLWVLIILSPLAFIMQVMPQTQEYAKQWWNKFIKQVLVLPVMVFFLWLTLSTMSGGDVATRLGVDMGDSVLGDQVASLTEISRFSTMANFFVPIAMLVVGLTVVGQMGVVGGSMAGKALDFGKKVATIATGYALGRKIAGATGKKLMEYGKAKYAEVPFIGTDSLKRGKVRLDRLRTQTPILRKIPLLGLYSKFHNKKLNEDSEKIKKLTEDTTMDTLGRKENLSLLDKAGEWVSKKTNTEARLNAGIGYGYFGFGKKHGGQIKYTLEAADKINKAEKTRSREDREQKAEGGTTRKVNEILAITTQADNAELDLAVNAHVNSLPTEERNELRQLSEEEWRSQNQDVVAELEDSEKKRLESERESETLKLFLEGSLDAKGRAAEISQVSGDRRRALTAYIGQQSSGNNLVKTQKDFETWKKTSGNENKTQADFLEEQFDKTKGGEGFKTRISELEAEQAVAKKKWETENQLAITQKLGEKNLTTESIAQRVQEAITRNIQGENDRRMEEAKTQFLTTPEGKALAERSQKRTYEVADRLAQGKPIDELVPGLSEEDKVKLNSFVGLPISARETVAEKIREVAHTQKLVQSQSQNQAAQAEAQALLGGSTFGLFNIMMDNMNKKAKEGADALVETLRNSDLEKRMKVAGDAIKQKMLEGMKGGSQNLANKMSELEQGRGITNVYARAYNRQTMLEKKKEEVGMEEQYVKERAKAAKINVPLLGQDTPSEILTPLAEKMTKELANLESGDAAALGANWIAHILQQKKMTGHISKHQQATLYGAIKHMAANGWIDDIVNELNSKINDLDSGVLQGEEAEKVRNLRSIFVDDLKIIHRNSVTGKFVSQASAEGANGLENLVAMGGDVLMLKRHQAIQQKMAEAKKIGSVTVGQGSTSTTLTADSKYQDFIDAFEKSGNELFGATGSFKKNLEKSQEFLQQASSAFKRAALNTGHIENGGHQIFDRDMGMYRMATLAEASSKMLAEASKVKGKEKWQHHSSGDINNETGRMHRVAEEYYRAHMGGINSSQQARQVVERTVDTLTGHKNGQEAIIDEGYMVLGHSKEDVEEEYAEDAYNNGTDASTQYLLKSIIPQLKENSRALGLVGAAKGKHVTNIDADKGIVKLKIAGTTIKADTEADLIRGVLDHFKGDLAHLLSDEDRRALEISLSKAGQNLNNTANPTSGNQAGQASTEEQTSSEYETDNPEVSD